MKEHCYWPLVSDFNNVLSHERVALVFLKDDNLIDMWFQFLSMLQGKLEDEVLGKFVECWGDNRGDRMTRGIKNFLTGFNDLTNPL
jgi:hypothetical protein